MQFSAVVSFVAGNYSFNWAAGSGTIDVEMRAGMLPSFISGNASVQVNLTVYQDTAQYLVDYLVTNQTLTFDWPRDSTVSRKSVELLLFSSVQGASSYPKTLRVEISNARATGPWKQYLAAVENITSADISIIDDSASAPINVANDVVQFQTQVADVTVEGFLTTMSTAYRTSVASTLDTSVSNVLISSVTATGRRATGVNVETKVKAASGTGNDVLQKVELAKSSGSLSSKLQEMGIANSIVISSIAVTAMVGTTL